jgi:hypothetical protein
MSKTVLGDGIFQRAGDVHLPNQIIEGLRPVFARENFVAHPKTLAVLQSCER